MSLKKLRKKQYLLQADDVCKTIAFVEKGTLRSYTIDEHGSEHIVEYANQKIIISITESDDQLQGLLPNSKIVKTLNRIGADDVEAAASVIRMPVECDDEDVFELVSAMVETLGFAPVRQLSLNNQNK